MVITSCFIHEHMNIIIIQKSWCISQYFIYTEILVYFTLINISD
jgi:hypothetical protein